MWRVLNQMEVDVEGTEFGCHAGRDGGVGDDAIELFGVGNMDEAAFVELGGIEDSDDFIGLLDHHLVEQGFFEVRGGDSVFDGERVHTEEEFVAAEVMEHGESKRTYHGEAFRTYVASDKHDIETLVAHEFGSDVHGVGEDAEVMETAELFGYFHGRCAGIEHDEVSVPD